MRTCRTTPRGTDGRPLKVTSLSVARDWVKTFFSSSDEPAGGFSRYVTVSGYSNSSFLNKQPNQALLKTSLADIYALRERAKAGDPDAERVLGILREYLDNPEE